MINNRFLEHKSPIEPLNDHQKKVRDLVHDKITSGTYALEQSPCAICTSDNSERLASKDRYGLPHDVLICKHCGLIYVNPRMNQQAFNHFYSSGLYRQLYTTRSGPTPAYFKKKYERGRRLFNFIERTAGFQKPLHDTTVLDIGCAGGGVAKFFEDRGCSVIGIDLDKEYVEWGRGNYGLDLRYATLETLQLEKPVDLVIMTHVLEHILDPVDELKRITTVLQPNGMVVLEVPGVKTLHRRKHNDFLKLLQNAHVFYFTRRTLRNLVQRAGLKEIAGSEDVYGVYRIKSDTEASETSLKSDFRRAKFYLILVEALRLSRFGYVAAAASRAWRLVSTRANTPRS